MSDLETEVDPNPAGIGRIIEAATYCRLKDEKRPGLVGLPDIRVIQVCPDDLNKPADEAGVAEGAPPVWFVRIVFDKLLDSSIEDLVPELDDMGVPTGATIGTLRNTQPVTLTCGGMPVPYDGYYVPNGNRSSWPLGPALFIQPLDPTSVETSAMCSVAIKDNVHNKAGQPVPNDQRSYQFRLAPMRLRFLSVGGNEVDLDAPELTDGSIESDPGTTVDIFWTAAIGTDIDPAAIQVFAAPNMGGAADPAVCNGGGAPVNPAIIEVSEGSDPTTDGLITSLDIAGGPTPLTTAWAPDTTYRIQFAPTAAVVPAQGGPNGTFPAGFKLCFHTSA